MFRPIFLCLIMSLMDAQFVHAVDTKNLTHLLETVKSTRSDGFVLLENGKVIAQNSSTAASVKIESMSATKSFVSLAIGFLIEKHLLNSIDTPVYEFFPEWNQGLKKLVTIRHLLEHTSGLAANPTTEDIYKQDDFVQYALDSDIITTPGTVFFYNNKAINLLAGVVQKASGKKIDQYLKENLFTPLGILDISWSTDHAGNPSGMAGLQIRPVDLAKVGQFILERGMVSGTQILSSQWIDSSFTPSQIYSSHGLLWWLRDDREYFLDSILLERYIVAGLSAETVDKLRPLVALKPMAFHKLANSMTSALGSLDEARKAYEFLNSHKLPTAQIFPGSHRGFAAEGYLGQFLVIFPEKKIVAVRMIRSESVRDPSADSYPDFIHDVLKL